MGKNHPLSSSSSTGRQVLGSARALTCATSCLPPPRPGDALENPLALSPLILILSPPRRSLLSLSQRARANPSSGQLASPPFRAAPRQADAAGRSAATPSTSSAQQRKPTGPESAESGPARAAGHRLSPPTPTSPRSPSTPPAPWRSFFRPRVRKKPQNSGGYGQKSPLVFFLLDRQAGAWQRQGAHLRHLLLAAALARRCPGEPPRPLSSHPHPLPTPGALSSLSLQRARANPSSGQLASPPFRAAPRQADAARRSAATPSTSSAQQRKPTGPESAESGPARAAGHRLSPPTPTSPALAVDTTSSVVSSRC
nr:uncharacterized protein LOC127333529 [Lolium perenne]